MRKGYYIIFNTYRSDTECDRTLRDALGDLNERSSVAIVKKMTDEEVEKITNPKTDAKTTS